MDPILLCQGKGLVLPNLSIDETAQHVRFLLISLPNNAMSVQSPFTIHKALKGIGGEPKSVKEFGHSQTACKRTIDDPALQDVHLLDDAPQTRSLAQMIGVHSLIPLTQNNVLNRKLKKKFKPLKPIEIFHTLKPEINSTTVIPILRPELPNLQLLPQLHIRASTFAIPVSDALLYSVTMFTPIKPSSSIISTSTSNSSIQPPSASSTLEFEKKSKFRDRKRKKKCLNQ
ncbi:hypothetical protein TNCV_748531 [Trichonephila clavipes]|nr:hypothetical protein TNCV_748531 [Trichonephila clavipes]